MDWTKILNKGWIYVAQTIAVIVILIIIIVGNGSRTEAEFSIREDIKSTRKLVDQLEENGNVTIGLITGVIDSNERITGRLTELSDQNTVLGNRIGELNDYNQRAKELASKLKSDNQEHTRRIRAVQDSALNSELTTDGIRRIISGIERENNYNR